MTNIWPPNTTREASGSVLPAVRKLQFSLTPAKNPYTPPRNEDNALVLAGNAVAGDAGRRHDFEGTGFESSSLRFVVDQLGGGVFFPSARILLL